MVVRYLPLLLGVAACHAAAPAHVVARADHPSLAPRHEPAGHPAPRRPLVLHVGHVLAPEGTLTGPMTIVLDGQRIAALGADLATPPGAEVLELPEATLLPGLIDTHTHVMASGADDYLGELTRKSLPFRALEASANVRIALAHGFTTLRDVERAPGPGRDRRAGVPPGAGEPLRPHTGARRRGACDVPGRMRRSML